MRAELGQPLKPVSVGAGGYLADLVWAGLLRVAGVAVSLLLLTPMDFVLNKRWTFVQPSESTPSRASRLASSVRERTLSLR